MKSLEQLNSILNYIDLRPFHFPYKILYLFLILSDLGQILYIEVSNQASDNFVWLCFNGICILSSVHCEQYHVFETLIWSVDFKNKFTLCKICIGSPFILIMHTRPT